MTFDEDPIDAAMLAQLRDIGDDDFIAELAQMYLADLEPRLTAIDAAVNAGDSAEVASAAHTLSGSSANLGLTKLAAAAKRLELHHRGEPRGAVEPMMAELHIRADQRRAEELATPTSESAGNGR